MRSGCYVLVVLALGSMNCRSPEPPVSDFDQLSHDVIYGSLALSPVSATAAGYHVHNGMPLDELVDNYSDAGIKAQRLFYEQIGTRLEKTDPARFDTEQQADLDIIRNNLALARLEIDTIQSYKHNPTVYVELAGNALFNPYVLNYASKEKRFQHITKRLERLPGLFQQARANLVDAPEVWNRVAREENDGNIDLIDHTLRADVPEAQKTDYERAADQALASLRA